ncbi:hypothetical protein CI102_1439 [Trichoderma harzianum]|nr:hypothetical protein CI102_1439 [Trichoderma harzianum]
MYVYIRKNLYQESTSLITTLSCNNKAGQKKLFWREIWKGRLGKLTTAVFSWQGRVFIIYLSYLGLCCFVFSLYFISIILPHPLFSSSCRFPLLLRFDTWRGVVLGPHHLGTHERQDKGHS